MYKVNTLMCTGKGAKRFYQGDKVPAISFENGAAAAMLKAGQLTDISVKQEVKVLSVAALSVKIKEYLRVSAMVLSVLAAEWISIYPKELQLWLLRGKE